MIDETKAYVEKNFPGAKVRYGDTDSVMVEFDVGNRTGKEAIEYSWEIGERAAEECTKLFKAPNNLELEKVYCPYFLYSKKRYAAKLWTKGKDGNMRPKMMYTEKQKREFIDLVFGQWNYFADTKSLTKATFSMDIPTKAIKILTYKNDIVLDPFMGSGTTALSAEFLDRRWIGIELSPNYIEVANKRLLEYRAKLLQMKLELEEVSKF